MGCQSSKVHSTLDYVRKATRVTTFRLSAGLRAVPGGPRAVTRAVTSRLVRRAGRRSTAAGGRSPGELGAAGQRSVHLILRLPRLVDAALTGGDVTRVSPRSTHAVIIRLRPRVCIVVMVQDIVRMFCHQYLWSSILLSLKVIEKNIALRVMLMLYGFFVKSQVVTHQKNILL